MPGQPRQRLRSGDEKFSPPKKATYPGQEVLLLRPARWGASLCYEHRVTGVLVKTGCQPEDFREGLGFVLWRLGELKKYFEKL